MKTIFYPANERGYANHGWLEARHSFSFASWYDESKIHFGALRVLNDDIVAPGMGFGAHPHDNMEIVTIPLKGSLEHKDSMGNIGVIAPGEIQAMSAGSGIQHSEYNHSKTDFVNLLQIWVFPKERNIKPRYEQIKFDVSERKNKFQLIVSPEKSERVMWINQDAYFSMADMDSNIELNYTINKKGNGAYIFVIDGSIDVEGKTLNKKDAIGISEIDSFKVKGTSPAQILVIEVPMF